LTLQCSAIEKNEEARRIKRSGGSILAVDDDVLNRELLIDLLSEEGYEVHGAHDGQQGLQMAIQTSPDLVILDVIMPGLNGIEVCKQLKKNPVTAPIPVIMVSALNARRDRLSGIEVGANDFISKPFEAKELYLRVRNAIFAKRLFDETAEKLKRLQTKESLRESLASMVVHDMRAPLSGLWGALDLLEMSIQEGAPEKMEQYATRLRSGISALTEMVSSILDTHSLEEGKLKLLKSECRINDVIRETIDCIGIPSNGCSIEVERISPSLKVFCDRTIIRRVLQNLLENAAKFGARNDTIILKTIEKPASVRIEVIDHGEGLDKRYHEQIFDKFGLANLRQKRLVRQIGLGLAFCKLAIEAHGGAIGLISAPEKGSIFWFELPLHDCYERQTETLSFS
jgi:two-component system, sensor histidine kinase and response regulator